MFKQIWLAWAEVFFEIPEEDYEMQNQFLWLNSHIRIANEPLYKKRWQNSNVDYVYQLKKENENRFLTYHEFVENHGSHIKQLEYYAILAAIPPIWRSSVKYAEIQINELTRYEIIEKDKNATKTFYWKLIEKVKFKHTHRLAYEQDLNIKISEEEWSQKFVNTFKITNSIRLRDFQYKIINKTLMTNVKRAKFVDMENTCTFCA